MSPLTPRAPHRVRWPAYRYVVFDCDATLAAVEGIDSLSTDDATREEIARLTDAAMSGTVPLEEVYGRRLDAIRPSKADVLAVRETYRETVVDGAAAVIEELRWLGHEVYVVSGGLAEPVREFAVHLGVDPGNVRAVEAYHDRLSGRWWESAGRAAQRYRGHEESELTTSEGKRTVIAELLAGRPGGSLLVGDGLTDAAARPVVDLMVGFGGVASRPGMADLVDVYVSASSLDAVLPLAIGTVGRAALAEHGRLATVDSGVRHVGEGQVRFTDDAVEKRFLDAFGLELPSAAPDGQDQQP